MVNIMLGLRRLLRLGINVKKLRLRVLSDMERLEVQQLADQHNLFASVSLHLQKAYGLLPHEISALSNEQVEYLLDNSVRAHREADAARQKRTP